MQTIVTLILRRALDASDTTSYEAERDDLIEKLQEAGWRVTIDDEEDTDDVHDTDYDGDD